MIEKILDCIKKIDAVGVIATLGLVVSLGVLAWNIIRDLIIDKIKLNLKVRFGGILRIRGTRKGIFIEKGSMPKKKIEDERILFNIVNSGRRPIMIEEIGAKYKLFSILRKRVEAKKMSLVSDKLPKILHPYEIFNADTKKIKEIYADLKEGNIKYFFVRDTKGKYWKNSRKNTKKLLNNLKELNR